MPITTKNEQFKHRVMMVTVNMEARNFQPSILFYLKDPANLCSIAGLLCSFLSIYFCILGIFYAALIWHDYGLFHLTGHMALFLKD